MKEAKLSRMNAALLTVRCPPGCSSSPSSSRRSFCRERARPCVGSVRYGQELWIAGRARSIAGATRIPPRDLREDYARAAR